MMINTIFDNVANFLKANDISAAEFTIFMMAVIIGIAFILAFIYVNTIGYLLEIKKYGKEEADAIRRRWI